MHALKFEMLASVMNFYVQSLEALVLAGVSGTHLQVTISVRVTCI